MIIHILRRTYTPILALLVFSAVSFVQIAIAAQSDIRAEDIADNLTVFYGAGGNVVVHEGPDSLLLIDGGSEHSSQALLSAIDKRYSGKPIVTLINTHWHLEQTGSNDALGRQGVEIIAHENTRRWMMTTIEQYFNGIVYQPRATVALPTRTFYHKEVLQRTDEAIALMYTPRAHTDGDIHAFFPKSNVIVAGGTAYAGSYPILDTNTNGWIGEMLDATRTLIAKSNENTIIVPSDGGLLSLNDLIAQEEMLNTVLERFKSMSREGKGADDMLHEGIADEYIEKWGDPTDFIYTAWDGLWDHMRGLGAF